MSSNVVPVGGGGGAGEGWVVRPVKERVNHFGDRVILKVKNPAFAEIAFGGDEGAAKYVAALESDGP